MAGVAAALLAVALYSRRVDVVSASFAAHPWKAVLTGLLGSLAVPVVVVMLGSGHNVGDAYVDGLTLLCDGDLDRAWSMTPEVDYEVKEFNYDARNNRFSSESLGRGKRSPVYLFVKLKK